MSTLHNREWESASFLQRAARSSVRLFLLKGVGIFLGLIRVSLLAYFFGIERSIEAFFGATTLLALSGKFLQSGAFSSVFVPIFLENQEKDRERVWGRLSNLFNLALLLGVTLWLSLFFLAPLIIPWLVPGFDEKSQTLVLNLFRIISPIILFSIVSSLSTSILNSSKKFGMPQFFGILTGILEICLIFFLVPNIGIYALGVGLLIGTLAEFILLISALYRMGFRYKGTMDFKDALIRETFKMVRPFFMHMIVFQCSSFFSVSIISFLPMGSYAIYRYATDLISKLSNLLNQPIGTVVYTYITEETAKLKHHEALIRLSKALKMTLLVTLAPTFIILLTSRQIIGLLLNRGTFDTKALVPLASAMGILGLGLFLNGAFDLFSKTLISLKRTLALNILSMIQQGFILLLVFLFSRNWGLMGAVWASPVSTLFGISLLGGILMYYRFPIIKEMMDLGFLKIVFAALIAYGVSLFFSRFFLNDSLHIVKIGIISLFFGTVYILICWLVRLEEFQHLGRPAARF